MLTQIAEKVSSTDALVGEIATAAREQAQGIEQINAAIAQMDKVSQSNSASAEESASAAEELDAQAETLKDLVAKLRLLVGGKSNAISPTPVSSARVLSTTLFFFPALGAARSPCPKIMQLRPARTTAFFEISELSSPVTQQSIERLWARDVPAAKAVRAI